LEDLTREGHIPKTFPLSSQDILYWRPGLLVLSRVGKVTAKVNIPTPLSDSFSGVMNFTIIRTKAVCAPKDKKNPGKNSI
jgi:hypothetical protein